MADDQHTHDNAEAWRDLSSSDATLPEGHATTEPVHLLPEHTSRGDVGQVAASDDPETARTLIEQTRARMSDTLDTIEEVLLRKKEKIQDRMDIFAPVRERPFTSVAAVFGASFVLGFLTGGDDESDTHESGGAVGFPLALAAGAGMASADDAVDWREQARLWEARARRLQRIAQQQDEQLSTLRDSGKWDDADGLGSLRAVGTHLHSASTAGVANLVTRAFDALKHRASGSDTRAEQLDALHGTQM